MACAQKRLFFSIPEAKTSTGARHSRSGRGRRPSRPAERAPLFNTRTTSKEKTKHAYTHRHTHTHTSINLIGPLCRNSIAPLCRNTHLHTHTHRHTHTHTSTCTRQRGSVCGHPPSKRK